jgi:3D (Asp-Asp-Asp) domain-containing protein
MFKPTNQVYQTPVKKALVTVVLTALFATEVRIPVAQAASPLPNTQVATQKQASNDTVDKPILLPSQMKALENEASLYHATSTHGTTDEQTDESQEVLKTMYMDMTAYTSAVNETDGSPFITADGSVVRDGIVATNALPFGSKIRIPSLFGDKVFTVHDRMNQRYYYRTDVWMTTKKEAFAFGVKRKIPIEVIEIGDGKKNWEQWKGKSAELNRVGKYGPKPEEAGKWL